MKQRDMLRGVILANLIAIVISSYAWAGDGRALTAPVTADSTLSLTRYFAASPANVGQFPGTLVRLSCDASRSADPTQQSGQPRHDYALVLEGEDVVHPLVPGTDSVRRELDAAALHGADVLAYGKYYPSTGAIFVSDLEIRKAGTVQSPASPEGPAGRLAVISLARCTTD